MTSKTLGVGIVGTGWAAGAHIDNFKAIDGCEVRGVCSRDAARAKVKIEESGLAAATPFDSFDAMLARDDIDVVSLCGPHTDHARQTIAAAQAGKHVTIEKPAAVEPGELRAMLESVAAAGVHTSVCFELRWIGLFESIKSILREKRLGDLFYGEANYLHGCGPWYPQYPWNRTSAMGRDAMLSAGCHALDALIWFMESPVVEVTAMASTSPGNPLDYEYDPNVTALFRFANGAIGKVSASLECRQPYLFPILLQGEGGTVQNDRIATGWPEQPSGDWAPISGATPDSGDVSDHPYRGQFEHFLDCIRADRRPHNDLASCAHVHEVMFAISESVRSGARVPVEPPPAGALLWGS